MRPLYVLLGTTLVCLLLVLAPDHVEAGKKKKELLAYIILSMLRPKKHFVPLVLPLPIPLKIKIPHHEETVVYNKPSYQSYPSSYGHDDYGPGY